MTSSYFNVLPTAVRCVCHKHIRYVFFGLD